MVVAEGVPLEAEMVATLVTSPCPTTALMPPLPAAPPPPAGAPPPGAATCARAKAGTHANPRLVPKTSAIHRLFMSRLALARQTETVVINLSAATGATHQQICISLLSPPSQRLQREID